MSEPTLHHDPVLFREAVNYTASRTGFNMRLIEKDYFCSVLLSYLVRHGGSSLVFKGGTCLAKVYAGFYRLSEDLDFAVSTPTDANRTTRQHAVRQIKTAVSAISKHLDVFTPTEPLKGANNSTQYNGVVSYTSPTTERSETILIEVSVREPLLLTPQNATAQTLLLNPISSEPAIPPVAIMCIDLIEALAEKFRAALSRKDVAIRDFYDIEHAARHLDLNANTADVIDLVRQKLTVPGNLPIDVGDERIAALHRQMDTRLRTVLRDAEFDTFDLNHAIGLVTAMAHRIA